MSVISPVTNALVRYRCVRESIDPPRDDKKKGAADVCVRQEEREKINKRRTDAMDKRWWSDPFFFRERLWLSVITHHLLCAGGKEQVLHGAHRCSWVGRVCFLEGIFWFGDCRRHFFFLGVEGFDFCFSLALNKKMFSWNFKVLKVEKYYDFSKKISHTKMKEIFLNEIQKKKIG